MNFESGHHKLINVFSWRVGCVIEQRLKNHSSDEMWQLQNCRNFQVLWYICWHYYTTDRDHHTDYFQKVRRNWSTFLNKFNLIIGWNDWKWIQRYNSFYPTVHREASKTLFWWDIEVIGKIWIQNCKISERDWRKAKSWKCPTTSAIKQVWYTCIQYALLQLIAFILLFSSILQSWD